MTGPMAAFFGVLYHLWMFIGLPIMVYELFGGGAWQAALYFAFLFAYLIFGFYFQRR